MNITKAITNEIVNQADRAAVSIGIYGVNEGDKAVFCNLFDAEGGAIATRRVFPLASIPCQALNTGEKEFIQGLRPSESWYTEEIKLWLDSKETKYPSNAVKADLIGLVEG